MKNALLEEADRPRGREEVQAALLRAADELFGLHGPDAVSMRQVAARAGVNHGLIHRHFGSKEKLLQAVLADHAGRFRAMTGATQSSTDAALQMMTLMAEQPAFVRILAHLVLSGHSPDEFTQSQGGLARRTERRLTELGLPHPSEGCEDARVLVAATSALSMGWLLFERFLLFAVGYSGATGEARAIVQRAMGRVLAPDSEASP